MSDCDNNGTPPPGPPPPPSSNDFGAIYRYQVGEYVLVACLTVGLHFFLPRVNHLLYASNRHCIRSVCGIGFSHFLTSLRWCGSANDACDTFCTACILLLGELFLGHWQRSTVMIPIYLNSVCPIVFIVATIQLKCAKFRSSNFPLILTYLLNSGTHRDLQDVCTIRCRNESPHHAGYLRPFLRPPQRRLFA